MIEFNHRRPRINNGDLRTPVVFYEYRPKKDSPYPDQYEYKKLYHCWAKVDRVWLKDLEQAKANNTVSDVTLTMRDPMQEFVPTNKHFIKVESFEYEGLVYNITSAQPDLQNRDFITVIAQLMDEMKWK